MRQVPHRTIAVPRLSWRWIFALLLLAVFLYGVRAVVAPFIGGVVIAYFLNPPVTFCVKYGVPRWLAALGILVVFLAFFCGLTLATTPIIYEQLTIFANELPNIVHRANAFALEHFGWEGVSFLSPDVVHQAVTELAGTLSHSLDQIILGGVAVFNLVTLVIVAPVAAFYLLCDWPTLVARVASWWPRRHDHVIRGLLRESDKVLSGFVRGQFLVAVCMAVMYTLGWGLIGLHYFLILGLIAGTMAFVPFLGPLLALLLSVIVAFGQFGYDLSSIGWVCAVFVAVQSVEGMILTPNLIGNRIGLHPAWVLFAVFAGSALMGIVGVFLSVPVAAVVGVFARWAMQEYRASAFYGALPAPSREHIDSAADDT